MPERALPVHLRWAGSETMETASTLVAQGQDFEIELPANLHHALFAHLHPGARAGEPEQVDAVGGPHLLTRVAEIAGFSPLAELIDQLDRQGATVHVVSPLPKVIVEFKPARHH